MNRQLNTCIAHFNGYFLWNENEKPVVVRKYTTNNRKSGKVHHELNHELTPESFGDKHDAKEAYKFLKETWDDYISWRRINAK